MISTDNIIDILPENIADAVEEKLSIIREIRLRVNRPLIYTVYADENNSNDEVCLSRITIKKEDIQYCMEHITNMSAYAFQNSIKQGFITCEGGHRIGIAGQMVVENNMIMAQKNISSINIRIARECMGCADKIMNFIFDGGMKHTLIVSPPGKGKTTLLRDCVRQLSDSGITVAVIDERGELGASYMGVPQCNLGMRTDVFDACPKAYGMLMAVRSMAPQVIAVDEIGQADEKEAIAYAMNCGVNVIATVHAGSIGELKNKGVLYEILGKGGFEKIIILDDMIGRVSEMIWL